MFRWMITAVVAALFAAPAAAQSISPTSFSDTVGVGGMTMETFTVTTGAEGPATNLVDIVFLADNTGSMGSAIGTVKANATSLLADILATGLDAHFGVASYFGDPIEGVTPGGPSLGNFGNAFNLITQLTDDSTAITAGINAWFASGGGDGPEGGLFALQQLATSGANTSGGIGTGLDPLWRPGAQKVIVWFGDINQHDETVDVAEAIAALTGEDVIVIAISTQPGPTLGLDGTCCGGAHNHGPDQAADIVAATGGLDLTSSTSGIVDAIVAAVSDVTSTIDLSLIPANGDFSGLTIDVTCISVEGCDGVGAGESRDFKVTFTGDTPGSYAFDLVVPGLSGVASAIDITVTGELSEVPVPAALPLLLTGLAGLGFASRRRRPRG